MHFFTLLIAGTLVAQTALFPLKSAAEEYPQSDVTVYRAIRFNNENWHTLPHPKVADFTMRADGSAFGLTENGISFFQYNIPNEYGIRVQRFEIEDHYHYIVGGEIADTFTEFSSLLAQAYQLTLTS